MERMYRQEGHPVERLQLTSIEYERAIQSLVKYCHDVILVGTDKRFYLAERKAGGVFPGPWYIGGAVRPFMPTVDSLVILVERETGLRFMPERFHHLGRRRYWFNGEGAGNVPHDALCEVFVLEITDEERSRIQLDPEEYSDKDLIPCTRADIEQMDEAFRREIFLDLWDDVHRLMP